MWLSNYFLPMSRVIYSQQCGEPFPWLWLWVIAKPYCAPWWEHSLSGNQNLWQSQMCMRGTQILQVDHWEHGKQSHSYCFLLLSSWAHVLLHMGPAQCNNHCFRAYIEKSIHWGTSKVYYTVLLTKNTIRKLYKILSSLKMRRKI